MTYTTAQPRRLTGAAARRRAVTLTGVQPTGDLHLGNYIGAIRPLADLALDLTRDVYVFIADLHALNSRPDPAVLRERSQRLVAALLVCGLDRPNVHVTGGIGYGEVKARLADAIDAHVAPMRNRYQRLLTDPGQLDARLTKAEQHARQRADRTLAQTVVAMGL